MNRSDELTSPTAKARAGDGAAVPDPPEPRRTAVYGRLPTRIYASATDLGAASARDFAEAVKRRLEESDVVSVIFASATSQLPFFHALRARKDVEWRRVHVFHMDEYLGMSPDHPASFRRFLVEQLLRWAKPASFHQLGGDAGDPEVEIERYSALLREFDPSICVLGIGENGHLAFNDPPADFAAHKLVHLVTLDDACRRQQWNEGHFASLDDVPKQALSLTIPALLKPRQLLCVVPERRKAPAVRAALEGPISVDCPASVLRTVSHATLYLDPGSGSLLGPGDDASKHGFVS